MRIQCVLLEPNWLRMMMMMLLLMMMIMIMMMMMTLPYEGHHNKNMH